MLTLYLACLITGAILLVISMFSDGDADSSVDHAIDGHGDFDHGLDAHADVSHDFAAHGDVVSQIDTHPSFDHGLDAHASVPAEGAHGDLAHASHDGALSAAFQFFSFRNIVYLTTFFGLTGSILTWSGTGALITLISSGGMGAFAMMIGHKFMRYLKDSESGQGLHERDFVGHVGKITLSPTKERKGKIRLTVGGQIVELVSMIHPDSTRDGFRYGEHALILDIEHNIALVDEASFADDTA